MGDRVAQLIVERICIPDVIVVDDLDLEETCCTCSDRVKTIRVKLCK